MLQMMAAPLAACVVLLGIHVYLGMHVLQRKVIFVDLALAQIAALGATMGFLMGIPPQSEGAFLFSLGFSVVGAAVFTMTRVRHERVPQEAIIGIVYVVALAAAILVADRAPEGAEHIKETLVGSILWVRWPAIANAALLFLVIGGVHFVFRRRLLQISFELDQAYREGRWVRLWDFLFYLTFAVVITVAVAIAGVLLVFSFLVIPAAVASLFAARVLPRLLIGWSVGIGASMIGLVASYRFDTPSGPTVVSSLGFALLLAGLLFYVRHADSKRFAALKILGGIAVVAGGLAALSVFFTTGHSLQIEHDHDHEPRGAEGQALHDEDLRWNVAVDSCAGDTGCAAERLRDTRHWRDLLAHRLAAEEPEIREQAIDVAAAMDAREARDLLAIAAGTEPDPLLRLREARILWGSGDRRGLEIAFNLIDGDAPPLARDEAHGFLLDAAPGNDFGYDPFLDREANEEPLRRWRAWIEGK